MRPTLLSVCLLASTAMAQTTMPLPPFTNTYTYATHTRGFFFQAPTTFVITGLQVPDETLNGTQNVEVLRLAGPPATTPPVASLFYSAGQPSTNVIPCAVLVNQGDWIGILGACGTTTMYNSYGASGFVSSVLGQPVTLSRLMLQANLNAAPTGSQVLYTNTASIGRVEVHVAPAAGYAASLPFGSGCTLSYSASARPVIGTTISLDTASVPAATLVGATVFGFTELNPGIDLTPLGMPGCTQYLAIDSSQVWVPAGGVGTTSFAIPNVPAFAGIEIFSQGAALAPGVNALGGLTSNALKLVLDVN